MDWRFNTIWFEQLNSSKLFKMDYKKNVVPENIFETSEYAILWHYKYKELAFDNLSSTNSLLYLEMNWANIKDFQKIEKLSNLKRLELHYCTKLETDKGLSSLKDTLEILHINQSRKFVPTDELDQLKSLKILCLNSCGSIESLDFLYNFPNLIDFRFVNTNVLNGDLSPILKHPTIRTVGFLNKQHYNYRDEEIDEVLRLKSNKEYKEFVYKEEYQTFKYL